ncbi:unnamed protein product [marine sediment metagenome]|uniref:Uncharacterized protein n=1 Tax=marine sediment metagenome TaxID=412755 RepID=X1SSS9_9ZZZZ
MAKKEKKTLGEAIDEIMSALEVLEPDVRTTAVTAACTHLKIPIGTGQSGGSAPSTPSADALKAPAGGPPPPKVSHIKTFKEEKKPRSGVEMACLVAYYLQELAPPKDRKDRITIADLRKYFKLAEFKLPVRIEQTLVNAKAAGYFDSTGSGSYKLNAVGYNLTVHTLRRKKSES